MSVKTFLLAGSVMAALTGCITSSRAYLPDGTEGWSDPEDTGSPRLRTGGDVRASSAGSDSFVPNP